MYDELVKRLRDDNACVSLKTLHEAADAIDERCQQVDKFAEEAARLYAKLPRWIPVTERFPDDLEMVIGFTPCDGFMFVGYHVTFIYQDCDFSYWNIVTAMRSTKKMTKKVTHWMPLPQPPKEE